MRAGAKLAVKRGDWNNAARYYGNLSELQLTLGLVPEAVADARRSLDHAERSGDAFMRSAMRTTLADALHQQGETGEAQRLFAQAEAIQAELQPQYPFLYSLRGVLYCDLLLAGAEGAAWSAAGGSPGVSAAGGPGWVAAGAGDPGWAAACEAVVRRATGAQRAWREIFADPEPLLDIARDHLTLARCALYADLMAGRPPGPEAQSQARRALDGLRAAGNQHHIPRGLLTRAWLRQAQGDPDGARADLAEAEQIASRGAMALHLADIALYRARLFRDPQALAQARRLIEAHGYRRRLPELEAAESAAPCGSGFQPRPSVFHRPLWTTTRRKKTAAVFPLAFRQVLRGQEKVPAPRMPASSRAIAASRCGP